jgi:hypothetical protein
MNLSEAAWVYPEFLVLHGVEELRTWLERTPRAARAEGRFRVRVRDRIVFTGPFQAALARYHRARDVQLWRRMTELRRPLDRPRFLRRPAGRRMLPQARRPDGGYAGRRRLSWRVLVPLRPPDPDAYRWPPALNPQADTEEPRRAALWWCW